MSLSSILPRRYLFFFHSFDPETSRACRASRNVRCPRDYHRQKESVSVNFAADNEGRENGSEESGTWHHFSGPFTRSLLFLPEASPLFPIHFVPRFHQFLSSRTSRAPSVRSRLLNLRPANTSLLRDSAHERNGSSHKNFTLAAYERFSQFFFQPLPLTSPSLRLPTEILVVCAKLGTCRISLIFRLARRNADEIDGWLPRYWIIAVRVFNIAIDAVNYI